MYGRSLFALLRARASSFSRSHHGRAVRNQL
jgi:hypothetical protein